jgi:hypothetical protein
VQTARGDTDTLVIGDLNAYGKEDPVLNLSGNGFKDLLDAFAGTSDYSYVFDGEAGYLDHALASASLNTQVVGAQHWHINADEPSVIDYNEEFFVYTSLRDALDVITDFTPGDDKLDLSTLATTLRASAGAGTNLLASGHIVLVNTANGLEVRVDSDGALGAGTARTLVRLQGVTSGQFLAARDLLL